MRELDIDALASEGFLDVELLLGDVGEVELRCLGDYSGLVRISDSQLVPLVKLVLVKHVLELFRG